MTGPSTTAVDDQLRPAPPEVEAVNAETSAILKARDELVNGESISHVGNAITELDGALQVWGTHLAACEPEELELARFIRSRLIDLKLAAEDMATRLAPQKAARDTAAAAELANDEAEAGRAA